MITDMRRGLQVVLAGWFAITVATAQSCVPQSQALSSTLAGASAAHAVGPAGGGAAPSPDSWNSAPEHQAAVVQNHLDTNGYTADQAESRALTEYLTQRKLPLVGAQVLNGPGGQRAVVLYGFVGSDFGRADAVKKAQRYINDPDAAVDNRIIVRPELLSSHSATPPAASSSTGQAQEAQTPPNADVQAYIDQQNQRQALSQYQQQQALGAGMSPLVPLIVLLGVLGAGLLSHGGSVAINPGLGGSPYGSPYGYPPPSNPYPGYPSMPPYGSSPYGSSPYGSAPSNPTYP